jgi:Cupin-like domain
MAADAGSSERHYGRMIETVAVADPAAIDFLSLTESGQPVLLKNLVGHWPIVSAARTSDDAACDHLRKFDAGHPLVVYRAPPEVSGRFFYNDTLTGFNFSASQTGLHEVLAQLAREDDGSATDSVYVGSTDLEHFFPGLRQANHLPVERLSEFGSPVLASIWIGNRTTAVAHYDMSNNIACCVAGRRRFTLFPPDQIANLYPGPLDPTPAGQVVSMVDIAKPDLLRFPNFATAMENAIIADMEPGDVLVYPAMWWHQVEAQASFNILINYWWNAVPAHIDTPMSTVLHALLSLRDRSDHEKAAWRNLFDYYVFGDPGLPRQHLPHHAQGALAPLTDVTVARRLRAKLLNLLNR